MGKCLYEALESLVLVALLGRSWEQGWVAANPMSTDGCGHWHSGDCPEQMHGPEESKEDDESVDSEETWGQRTPVP